MAPPTRVWAANFIKTISDKRRAASLAKDRHLANWTHELCLLWTQQWSHSLCVHVCKSDRDRKAPHQFPIWGNCCERRWLVVINTNGQRSLTPYLSSRSPCSVSGSGHPHCQAWEAELPGQHAQLSALQPDRQREGGSPHHRLRSWGALHLLCRHASSTTNSKHCRVFLPPFTSSTLPTSWEEEGTCRCRVTVVCYQIPDFRWRCIVGKRGCYFVLLIFNQRSIQSCHLSLFSFWNAQDKENVKVERKLLQFTANCGQSWFSSSQTCANVNKEELRLTCAAS